MYLLRPAKLDDLAAIMELARHLDSPNLPHDEAFVRGRLERSRRSFAEPVPPSADREYQLALEDAAGQVVGTCAVLAKHGTPEMPHLYLRVSIEERRAESVDVTMKHCILQLGASTDGPSEVGSLVLLPEARGVPGSPGKLLSWGRFALIAQFPSCFEASVLAEMRATLDENGRNAFWESFGQRFTDMSYLDADRLSAENKNFIVDLFPDIPFYATLLPDEVMEELGCVHPETTPALRLLQRAGFHWIGEIDPFDAGPFVGARTEEVIPIRDAQRAVLASETLEEDHPEALRWIISCVDGRGFRAVMTRAALDGDQARLDKETVDRLGLGSGAELLLTPAPTTDSILAQKGELG